MKPLRPAAALAWRIVSSDRDRLAKSIAAIGFALLLILVQLGFRSALVDSSIQFMEIFDADVIVMRSGKDSFLERDRIQRNRLYQARSVEGVAVAYPIYLSVVLWKNPESGSLRPIRIVGFNPDEPVFADPEIQEQTPLLRMGETVLFDRKSRDYFGYDGSGRGEVSRRRVDVVGTVSIGTDFELDGTILVGEDTFFRLDPEYSRGEMEMVIVRVEPGADPGVVAARMNEVFPPEAEAFSMEVLRERERRYWSTATPVGIIFLVGTAVGFLSGIIILYQVLFALINDHLAEFAMMKAIGYDGTFLILLVLILSVTLAGIGFLGSMLASAGIYQLIAWLTGLPLHFTLGRGGAVAVLAVAMSASAGMLALGRVLRLDPAEVFK